MISRMKFFNMVQEYRVAQKTDVSRYAANYSYLELLQGNKTALVERMEQMFCREVDNKDLTVFLIKKDPEERTCGPKPGNKRKTFNQIDYLSQEILLNVLDPSLNLDSKLATVRRAFKMDKIYMVLECPYHGVAMHRTSVSTPAQGKEREPHHFNKYCLLCKIGRQAQKERADDVRTFLKNYLAFRERVNQSAS